MEASQLWTICQGQNLIAHLEKSAWRIVETQHISSTRKLVDSAHEHDTLEMLVEKSKPKYGDESYFLGLHYLLSTPFRYPPLQYGSRFGKRSERSLWYGSLEVEAALAEVAYYRLYFLSGSRERFGISSMWLTAFQAEIKTQQGLDLTKNPFKKYKTFVSSPSQYETSQSLGAIMRKFGVEAFSYFSARSEGTNIGLFTPKAFRKKKPNFASFQTWQCLSDTQSVGFISENIENRRKLNFNLSNFYVKNKLPVPVE